MFKLSGLRRFFVVGMMLAVAIPLYGGEDQPVESRIASAGLFKNGLAVIRQVVEVPGPGRYRLDNPPEPRHGTWWVESDALVETRTTEVEMEVVLPDTQQLDFQRSLAGLDVEIHLKGGGLPSLSGRVVRVERTWPEPSWNRAYEQSASNYWAAPLRGERPTISLPPAPFLLLETDNGTSTYVDTSLIASLRVTGTQSTGKPKVKVLKPALIFDVKEVRSPRTEIWISYLAKGIAWAPSYRIDLTDPQRLELQQKAVIKNELTDLQDTEIQLISGFPNISFGHVTSPLSATTSWCGTSTFSQASRSLFGTATRSWCITRSL